MTLPKAALSSVINKHCMAAHFILASASPRRRQLLASVGIVPDEVIPADIDETEHKGERPRDYVARVADGKCAKVAALHPDSVVLAADTAVACGRRILPKAEDEATARACLRLLSGRRHRTYSGISLYLPEKGKRLCRVVQTVVKFRLLNEDDIDQYIASGEWDGKAGGYAIQGSAQRFIPAINGSYSNVVGLPLNEVCRLLQQAGIYPSAPTT